MVALSQAMLILAELCAGTSAQTHALAWGCQLKNRVSNLLAGLKSPQACLFTQPW